MIFRSPASPDPVRRSKKTEKKKKEEEEEEGEEEEEEEEEEEAKLYMHTPDRPPLAENMLNHQYQ